MPNSKANEKSAPPEIFGLVWWQLSPIHLPLKAPLQTEREGKQQKQSEERFWKTSDGAVLQKGSANHFWLTVALNSSEVDILKLSTLFSFRL